MAPEEKLGRSGRVGWGVGLEWVRWEEGSGLETGGLLHPGGDPGAPKGAKWAAEKDSPRFNGGLGTGNEEAEDSTIRE